MKKRHVLPMMLSLLFVVGVVGCSNNNGDSKKGDNSQQTTDEKITVTAADGKKKLIKGDTAETVQLTASVTGVTWSSSKEEVATVDANGLVTAVGKGTATIKASKDGYKDGSISITVELEKIVITSANDKKEILAGETLQLSANKTGVTWESADNNIATVNASGLVTGVAFGDVAIKASKDGYEVGQFQVSVVRSAALATLPMESADHYSADGWWASGAQGPGATPIYTRSSGNASNGTCIAYFDNGDKETLTFSSSAAIKAEVTLKMAYGTAVSDLGAVMNIKVNDDVVNLAGKAGEFSSSSEFIEISLGEHNLKQGNNVLEVNFLAAAPYLDDVTFYSKDKANIAVVPAPNKETIEVKSSSVSVQIGKTAQIEVLTSGTDFTFTCDKPDVAIVDATGLVTGVTMGSASIIVRKDGYYSAKVNISVTEVLVEGEIRVEAESADEVIAGTSAFMNLTDSTSGITRAHSGGGYLSGYNVTGEETLTFKFESPKAQTMTLTVVGSAAYGITTDFEFATSTTMTLNTGGVNIDANAKILAGDGSMSAPAQEALIGDVSVNNGENTFVVVFHGSAPSLDVFKFVPKN